MYRWNLIPLDKKMTSFFPIHCINIRSPHSSNNMALLISHNFSCQFSWNMLNSQLLSFKENYVFLLCIRMSFSWNFVNRDQVRVVVLSIQNTEPKRVRAFYMYTEAHVSRHCKCIRIFTLHCKITLLTLCFLFRSSDSS